MDNLYDAVAVNYVHHLTQALLAKELYKRDKDYLVAQGEVKIVDEFTGRTLDGRRWSDGLHQAVEAKERVRIKEENHTWATVTLQNYFRLYEKLAGMTGTAETEASEFANTYELPVVPIPTNKPMVRDDEPDLIYKSRGRQVRRRRRGHRRAPRDRASRCWWARPRWPSPSTCRACSTSGASPTRSSTPSSTSGRRRSWPRPAGWARVTVATNMAGRGVDIILGGNPEGLAAREAARPGARPRRPRRAQAELAKLRAEFETTCGRGRARSASSAASTSSAASATRAGASTTSCGAGRAARATRARAASSCPSRTT